MATQGKSVKPPTAPRHPIPETVHKQCFANEVKALDEADRTIRFRISTGDLDREKDVVDPRGWRTDEFMKNPVVLFGHDYKSLPVARALSLSADEHGLSMVAQFPTKDVYPFADTVYQMVKGGFLSATSVGFKPVKWNLEPERGGVTYHEQILLEASLVPVPANASALVEARALGIDTEPLRAWATKILELKSADDEIAPVITTLESSSAMDDTPGEVPSPAVEPPAQPTPVLETKAGRVLSGRNETALREATAALQAAVERVNEVLAQVGAGMAEDADAPADEPTKPEDEEASKATDEALQPILTITDEATAQVEKDLVVLRLVDDPEPRFTLDPAMMGEVIARGLVANLAPVVDARVGAALSALRGRID